MAGTGRDAARDEVAVVREMFEAFRRRDLAGVVRFLDESVEVRLPVTGGFAGRSEPYRGHQGVRDYFADVESVWDELDVEPVDFRAAAGSVVIFGHVHGRRGAEVIDGGVLWTWKLRDGLIVSGASVPTGAGAAQGGEPGGADAVEPAEA